jgi:adhesin/invasin
VASQTTLTANQSSIITVNVVDGSGNPVSGETVTFTLPIKNSGVPVLSSSSSTTDGRGNAITIYTPGIASPTSSVEDILQASLTNGSTRALTLTRSGTAVAAGVTAISTIVASQTTLTANQSSIITVNVVDGSGNPVSGETVTFDLPVKKSGTPTLSSASGATDGRGNVITIYNPGNASPTSSVEDVIQASLANGSTRAITITRSGTASAVTSISTFSASQTQLTASQNSIITAVVTDSSGNPVSGETVTFTIPIKPSGAPTLTVASGATDGEGMISTVYTPGTASLSSTVEDIVQASISNGSTRVLIMTRSGSAVVSGPILSRLVASPSVPINAGHVSIITAEVTNASGTPVSGETVTFTLPVKNTGSPAILPLSGTTDGEGKVVAIYIPGITPYSGSVDDAVQATITSGSSQAVIITRSGSGISTNTVSLDSLCEIVAAGNTCTMTATVRDSLGGPVVGETVNFVIAASGSGSPVFSNGLNVFSNTTGAGGTTTASYTAGATANRTDVIRATITGADTALVIHVQ